MWNGNNEKQLIEGTNFFILRPNDINADSVLISDPGTDTIIVLLSVRATRLIPMVSEHIYFSPRLPVIGNAPLRLSCVDHVDSLKTLIH